MHLRNCLGILHQKQYRIYSGPWNVLYLQAAARGLHVVATVAQEIVQHTNPVVSVQEMFALQ